MLLGSPPRLRLYTSIGQYVQAIGSLIIGSWRKGSDIESCEGALAERLGVRHVVMTTMARVGIYLAIKHTVKPGQKVIMSPYTIADVVNMVVCAGGVPLFADLDENTCNLSASSVGMLLDAEPNVGAVLATHFYGLACDVVGIGKLCQGKNVPLIEDAAQAFGVRVKGQPVGTFGRAGVFSFGLYKNVNSFYGGAVATNDDKLAREIRAELSGWGAISARFYFSKVLSGVVTDVITWPPLFRIFSFQIFRFGMLNDVDAINNKLKIDTNPVLRHELPPDYKASPAPLQARLVQKQLGYVDDHTRERQIRAQRYRDGLAGIAEIRLPPKCPEGEHMYWYFPILVDDREALVKDVMRQGRDITLSYHRNCAALSCFAEFYRDCPNAERTASSVIYLPTYPRYPLEEVDRTVLAIRRYFGAGAV